MLPCIWSLCACLYLHFVSQVGSVQRMVEKMVDVESPSQVHDEFMPFLSTLAALLYSLPFFSGVQSARKDGRDDASGISDSGT